MIGKVDNLFVVAGNGIGVKIIIEMHTVDVVTLNHVYNNSNQIVAHLRNTRIEIFVGSIGKKPFGFGIGDMLFAHIGILYCGHGAKRIKPCVILHTLGVSLFYHKFQRVEIWHGGASLLAGKPFAPRLKFRSKKSVGGRTHLKYHGIVSCVFPSIEQIKIILLKHLAVGGSHSGIVDTFRCSHPNATKFACSIWIVLRGGFIHHHKQNKNK